LRNALDGGESASFHLHGSGLYVAATREAALASNPDALVAPHENITYESW